MKKIYVLGAGRVGSAIAKDLTDDFEVTSIDKDQAALDKISTNKSIKTLNVDLRNSTFTKLVKEADLVISAVPGFMGFETLKKIILTGKNAVDISFFPEDPFELNELAMENHSKSVVDCGIAPGMGNIILGSHEKTMEISYYECLVGGLPLIRKWPWEYKAVFSPIDVIEEYIRPARFVQGGQLVVREALSDPELIEFDGLGTLESFNTDGLRTLLKTTRIPDMIEKTLRYPGTIEYLRVLRESGFFTSDPVELEGRLIKPIDFTSRILFPQWELKEGEEDITVMRIIIGGTVEGKQKMIRYDLFDRYDNNNKILSMARTTGYTCTAVARLMIEDRISETGIIPPEYIGRNKENFELILSYLSERNVIFRRSELPDIE